MPANNLPIIFEILAAYDRGMSELVRGCRFVWQRGEPLQYAIHRYVHLNAYFFPHPDYRDRGAQAASYPPKVDALAQLLRALEYQMEHVPFAPGYTDPRQVLQPGGRHEGDSVYRFDGDESMHVGNPNATKSNPCARAQGRHCGYHHPKLLEMLCHPKTSGSTSDSMRSR